MTILFTLFYTSRYELNTAPCEAIQAGALTLLLRAPWLWLLTLHV